MCIHDLSAIKTFQLIFKQMTILISYFRKYQNLKMRTQFIIFHSLLILMIAFLMGILVYVNFLLLKKYFFDSSNQMYIGETLKTLNMNNKRQEMKLLRIFDINENQLKALSSVYIHAHRIVKQMDPIIIYDEMNLNWAGINPIPKSLVHPQRWGQLDVTYGSQCYTNLSYFGAELSREQKIGVKIQEFYVGIGHYIHQGEFANQGQYYGYFEADTIITEYPCVGLAQTIYNYIPAKRDWYITAKRLYRESENKFEFVSGFTKPYLQYTQEQIGIALVLPVVNETGNFIGGFGTGIILSQVLQLFKLSDEKIETMLLIDEQGILLMHPFQVSFKQLPLFIYNESITGFGLSDWKEILNSRPVSNCNTNIPLQGLLCRRNSKFNKDLLIGIQYIRKYNMYLLTLLDNSEYKLFFDMFEDALLDRFQQKVLEGLVVFLLQFVACCIFVYFASCILFKPIENIISGCNEKIFEKSTQGINQLPKFSDSVMSTKMSELYISFTSFFNMLNKLSFTKSTYCKYLELIQYPKKIRNKQIDKTLIKLKLPLRSIFSQRFKSIINPDVYDILRICNNYYNS